MTKQRKDTIAVTSGVAMLFFGVVLTSVGFFVEPIGEVHNSVLWILGQVLLYAGGIFGIATYTHRVVEQQVGDLEQRMRSKEEEPQPTTEENEE